jgi:hypothetical protein
VQVLAGVRLPGQVLPATWKFPEKALGTIFTLDIRIFEVFGLDIVIILGGCVRNMSNLFIAGTFILMVPNVVGFRVAVSGARGITGAGAISEGAVVVLES